MGLFLPFLLLLTFWTPAEAGQGPKIELSDVLAGSRCVLFEGQARSRAGRTDISYAIVRPGAEGGPFQRVKGEDFSIKVQPDLKKPGESVELRLQAADGSGTVALMKATVSLGYDGKLHYTILYSKNALDLRGEPAGPFTLLYPPGPAAGKVPEAARRLTALTRLADEALGMGDYPSFGVLLYSPEEPGAATYAMFRGFTDSGFLFAFPAPLAAGGALPARDYVLDDWVPHELGDHGAREFAKNKFSIRWLSEGTGDYLRALWLAGGKPGPLDFGRGAPAHNADLLDGDWSPDHYACSARFVKSLTEKHPGVLKRLFGALRDTPKEGRTELQARETLSRLIGADVTPALKSCGEAP